MESNLPNVQVGLQDIISGAAKTAEQNSSQKTSLISSHSSHKSSAHALDLPTTDILGPSEVVKRLFTLPYSNGNECVALHRLGNTLVVDSVPFLEEKKKNGETSSSRRLRFMQEIENTDSSLCGGTSDVLDYINLNKNVSPDDPSKMDCSHNNSIFLPPPEYYLPQSSQGQPPFRHVMRWQLSDINLVTGTNMMISNTPQHPSLTLGPIDTSMSKSSIRMTCLDYYLDNMMAAVPELAVCLHSKGFLNGVGICPTHDIPALNIGDPSLGLNSQSSRSFDRPTHEPLFDPNVVEHSALAIMRFLQQTCSKENGTYILHRSAGGGKASSQAPECDNIQVFDLEVLSSSSQRKWKWLLAMVSHRFALRLGQHKVVSNPVSKEILSDRQMSLLNTCYNLLMECRQFDEGCGENSEEYGSGDRSSGTLRAAVLEQIADIHLKRAQVCQKGRMESYTAIADEEVQCSDSSQHQRDSKKRRKKTKKKKKAKKSTAQEDSSSLHHDISIENEFSSLEVARSTHSNRNNDRHVDEQDDKCLNSTVEGNDLDEEPINFRESINTSIDMLKRAMDCVLEDIWPSTKSNPISTKPDTMPPIMFGDLKCSPVLNDSTGSSDNVESESVAKFDLQLSLAMQYTGLLHKAILACHVSIVEKLDLNHENHKGSISFSKGKDKGAPKTEVKTMSRGANISLVTDCVGVMFSALLPYCLGWLKLTNHLKLKRSRRNDSHCSDGLHNTKSSDQGFDISLLDYDAAAKNSEEDDIQDMWSMDRTMLADLPMLWDIIGTLCRSATAATSHNNAPHEAETSLLTWMEECDSSVRSVVLVLLFVNIVASRQNGIEELEVVLADLDPHALVSNAENLEAGFYRQYITDICCLDLFLLPSNELQLWNTLCGCKSSQCCSEVFSETLQPLFIRFVAALRASLIDSLDRGVVESFERHSALFAEQILSILKVQGLCCVMATLLICRAQSNWCQDQWQDQSIQDLQPRTSNVSSSGCDKSKVKRPTLRSGSNSAYYYLQISLSSSSDNHEIFQYVRHLADTCNEIGQSISSQIMDIPLTSLAASESDIEEQAVMISLENMYSFLQSSMIKMSSIANSYYSFAISLFESLCDTPSTLTSRNMQEVQNIIVVECNRCMLNYVQAVFTCNAVKKVLKSDLSVIGGETDDKTKRKKRAFVLIHALLGKEGNPFSHLMDHVSKKQYKQINSFQKFALCDSSTFDFQYTPLDFIKKGISLLSRILSTYFGSPSDEALNEPPELSSVKDLCFVRSRSSFANLKFFQGTLYHESIQVLNTIFDSKSSIVYEGNSSRDVLLAAVVTRDRYIMWGISAFQTANKIYIEVRMRQNEASSSYYLAKFYMNLFHRYVQDFDEKKAGHINSVFNHYSLASSGLKPFGDMYEADDIGSAGEEALRRGLEYYSSARDYFLNFDVNPTLVRILTDMWDIYMSRYCDEESDISKEISDIKQSLDSSGLIAAKSHCSQAVNLLPKSTFAKVLLLGNALDTLLDCRYALTDTVINRNISEMETMAIKITELLLLSLKKMLRLFVLLTFKEGDKGDTSSLWTEHEACLRTLKEEYSKLLVKPTFEETKGESNVFQHLYSCLERLNSTPYLRRFCDACHDDT